MTRPHLAPGRTAVRLRAAVALLAALALLPVLALRATPVGAQPTDPDADEEAVSLTVHELTGVLRPDGDLRVRIRVSNPGPRAAEGLRVVGTLHRAVASRFALQVAVEDGELATVVDGVSAEIDALGPGRSTVVELERSAMQLGFRRADQFGVYPLRLQLLEQGEIIDEVRTALVFAPEEVDEPVRTAFLLPVDAPPLLRTTRAYERDALLAQLSRGGRVQGLIGSLAARPEFPATLAPDALLLDEATDLAGGFPVAADPLEEAEAERQVEPDEYLATQARRFLERTREVAARSHVDVLAMPYGRADLAALVRGDMIPEAVRHIEESRSTLAGLAGGGPIEGALWPPDALNPAVLTMARRTGVDTVVLSERHLAIADSGALTPSPVRELARARGASPTVLVPDPWLEDVLAQEGSPDGVAVAVQRVVAETAAVYFERPFSRDVRGLVLAPPQLWSPDRGLVGGLLDALGEASWLEPVTLSRLARTVEPEPSPVSLDYSSAAVSRELPPSYVAALADARRALGSLATVLAPVSNDTPSRFDRLLRAAASVHFRIAPDTRQGRQMIAEVATTVAGLYDSVEIVDGPQVWMEEEGPVPVTVVNTAEVPLRVRVRMLSQRFAFEEPNGRTEVLEANGSRTLTFHARAVTPGGRAPISVVVEDPDGVLVLAEGTVAVRSTAVSVAALVLTGGAGLFLLVWFVQQAARWRRRPRGEGRQPPASQPSRPAAQAGRAGRR